MSDMMRRKQLLRVQVKEKRKQLSQNEHEQWSSRLNANLIKWMKQLNPTHIKGFIPYAGEPNIWPFIHYCWSNAITFIVPKCEQQTSAMTWYSIEREEQLIKGAYNILEPNPLLCKPIVEEVKLVLVPGLAFTNKGDRLGYGGGYYDRFYERTNGEVDKWIGVCFAQFIYEALPTEKHDFKCNFIVTDAGVIEHKIEEKGRI